MGVQALITLLSLKILGHTPKKSARATTTLFLSVEIFLALMIHKLSHVNYSLTAKLKRLNQRKAPLVSTVTLFALRSNQLNIFTTQRTILL